MNKEIQDFLESGLLDKYLIGDTTITETQTVERYISKYPEIEMEYEILQSQLEINARANAKKAPSYILSSVMDAIEEKPVIQLQQKPRVPRWLTIAACIAALVFAGTSFTFYNQNKSLVDENNTIADEIFDLRDDIEDNNNKLDEVMKQLQKLNNPETQKYVLRGNERAKDLKTVAYINPVDKSSLIDVISLPKLSDEQYYKMWAHVNNQMVDLGVIDETNNELKSVPYIEDALSLSITIESKDGSSDSEVAQIKLENQD
ncbi:anti-sigma factor domain-containing protein [Pontimicrobium sp. IMCC45349]|jgi:hypothetical protein|uniref:anti-sigma factor domain-containing protein n=1 Tax=Pontimicrobium sp. IMCC45349 TaxID=3391574 RepID=UPI0039A1E240